MEFDKRGFVEMEGNKPDFCLKMSAIECDQNEKNEEFQNVPPFELKVINDFPKVCQKNKRSCIIILL